MGSREKLYEEWRSVMIERSRSEEMVEHVAAHSELIDDEESQFHLFNDVVTCFEMAVESREEGSSATQATGPAEELQAVIDLLDTVEPTVSEMDEFLYYLHPNPYTLGERLGGVVGFLTAVGCQRGDVREGVLSEVLSSYYYAVAERQEVEREKADWIQSLDSRVSVDITADATEYLLELERHLRQQGFELEGYDGLRATVYEGRNNMRQLVGDEHEFIHHLLHELPSYFACDWKQVHSTYTRRLEECVDAYGYTLRFLGLDGTDNPALTSCTHPEAFYIELVTDDGKKRIPFRYPPRGEQTRRSQVKPLYEVINRHLLSRVGLVILRDATVLGDFEGTVVLPDDALEHVETVDGDTGIFYRGQVIFRQPEFDSECTNDGRLDHEREFGTPEPEGCLPDWHRPDSWEET